MSDTQPPKGTFDILPYHYQSQEIWKNTHYWQFLENTIRNLTDLYGYKEIRTPIFERTELFQKNTGESSDIVTKEMYTFSDKGQRSMTLRPEGTPAAMRAFLDSYKPENPPITKLFYIGPMFRYERPQAGRYRQHHQFGVEVIGSKTPAQDAEVIDLLYTLYKRLELQEVKVCINTLGTTECRLRFRQALKDYLSPYFSELSPDSQNRFHTNPLRILDSKELGDQKFLTEAPRLSNFLNQESISHFQQVLTYLETLEIPYSVEERLVRGLDYYNHTVFEVITNKTGAQSSLGGGGRYDGLLKSMGGPDLPTVGFGTGLERILRTMMEQNTLPTIDDVPNILLIPLGKECSHKLLKVASELRKENWKVSIELSEMKLKKALSFAEQIKTPFVCIMGENELQNAYVQIKNMDTRETENISLDQLIPYFKNRL